MNAATTQSYLQSAYDSGKLNPQILLDPRLDGEVAKEWEKLVPILSDPTVKGELDTIGQRVKRMMGQMLPTAELEGDTNSLITRAKEILRKRILQGIKSGQYDTPAEAALAESIKLSKTIAEKAAWDFVDNQTDESFSMTTIHPGMVFGPLLSNDIEGISASLITKMITGKFPALPDIYFTVVDVRDVAKLQVQSLSLIHI